jgi:hypothetical protein
MESGKKGSSLAKLVSKYVEVNYTETIYRAFHVLKLEQAGSSEEAQKILNTRVERRTSLYYEKNYV